MVQFGYDSVVGLLKLDIQQITSCTWIRTNIIIIIFKSLVSDLL